MATKKNKYTCEHIQWLNTYLKCTVRLSYSDEEGTEAFLTDQVLNSVQDDTSPQCWGNERLPENVTKVLLNESKQKSIWKKKLRRKRWVRDDVQREARATAEGWKSRISSQTPDFKAHGVGGVRHNTQERESAASATWLATWPPGSVCSQLVVLRI